MNFRRALGVMLLGCLAVSAVHSAPDASPASLAPVRVQSENDLQKLLLATAWSWERPGVAEELNFFDDNTAQHTAFRAKYRIKSVREVELTVPNGHKAQLIFDDGYTRYLGTDFDGTTPIHGQRKNEPPPGFLRGLKAVTALDVTVELVAHVWAFEAPKANFRGPRRFNQDGTWSQAGSGLKGTWKIQDNRLLVTLGTNPASPEIYHLPPRVFDVATGKIHLEGSGSNGDAVRLDLAAESAAAATTQESAAPGGKPSYFGTGRP